MGWGAEAVCAVDERDDAWDFVADVVVVGADGAALTAALRAHDGGASVIVVGAACERVEPEPQAPCAAAGPSRSVMGVAAEAYDYVREKGVPSWGTVGLRGAPGGSGAAVRALERRARWQGVQFLAGYRTERLLRGRGGGVCGLAAARTAAVGALARRGFARGSDLLADGRTVCVRAVRGVVLACCRVGAGPVCAGLRAQADTRCCDIAGSALAGLFACGSHAGRGGEPSCAIPAGYLAGLLAAGRR
jgi:hypothetical protein